MATPAEPSATHALHDWAWTIVCADGNDLSVDDMEQLEEREHAERRVQVEHGSARLVVGNPTQYLDALHNRNEIGQSLF